MRKRNAFRPTALDALEDRIVMSQASLSASTSVLVGSARTSKPALEAATSGHHARQFAATVGVLGDSFSDEYQFYPPNRTEARSWVEILSATRNVNFGQFTTRGRGEPRNQGFAFNWSRTGATSSDMLRNQLPGLRSQVANGRIDYATVFIGVNDYLQFLGALSAGQVPSNQLESALAQVEARVKMNFNSAVNALLTANPKVKLVAATVADSSFFPASRAVLAIPGGQSLLNAVSASVQRYNTVIREAANHSRIALLDLAAVAAQFTSAGGSTGMVPFGGITIDAANPGNQPNRLFLADGFHVGTVAQGIIASQFISAVNGKFDAGLAPLFPRQIVRFAQRV